MTTDAETTPDHAQIVNGKPLLRESLGDRLRRLLVRRPKVLIAGWAVVVLAFVLLIPVVYLCWYYLPQLLFTWANVVLWHWLPALVGFLFLFAGPLWVGMAASSLTSIVADASLSIEERTVREARQTVRETEEDALHRLEETDKPGLLPLLKYSRAQLEQYYAVGLSQTRRSFFNSVMAMWLGFVLLLVGVAFYVAPVERLGLKAPAADFRVLIMGGAAIIEFISALFLWVYRSSTAQLTYFYNRQMHTHTAILCFRIASTMEQTKADETKVAIVERVLDWTTMPERPPLGSAKGLRALLADAAAKTGA